LANVLFNFPGAPLLSIRHTFIRFICVITQKNSFAERFKILAGYRSEK